MSSNDQDSQHSHQSARYYWRDESGSSPFNQVFPIQQTYSECLARSSREVSPSARQNYSDLTRFLSMPVIPVHHFQPTSNNSPLSVHFESVRNCEAANSPKVFTNSEISQNVSDIQHKHPNNNKISSFPRRRYENSPLLFGVSRLVDKSNDDEKYTPQCDLEGNAMNQSNVVTEEGKKERTTSGIAPLQGRLLGNVSRLTGKETSNTDRGNDTNIKSFVELKPMNQQTVPSKQFFMQGDKIFSVLTGPPSSNETPNIAESSNSNHMHNSTVPLWTQSQNLPEESNSARTQLNQRPNFFLIQSQPTGQQQCTQYAVAASVPTTSVQAIPTVPVIPEGQLIFVSSQTIASVLPETAQQESSHKESEPCKICGDKSSGNHYGVASCEGCKGFFRRSIQNNKDLKCAKDGKCLVLAKTRNRCPACRLKKCLECGMDKNSVQKEKCRKRKNDDGMSAPGAKRLCESLLDDDSNSESVSDISKDILELWNSSSLNTITANDLAAFANPAARILSGLQRIASINIRECEISDVVRFLRGMIVNFEDALGNEANKEYPLLLVLGILHSWSKRDGVTVEEATKIRIIVGELIEGVERDRAIHGF